jgi:hypothetical protein
MSHQHLAFLKNFIYLFLAVLGFELKGSWLASQVLYHLSHSTSPDVNYLDFILFFRKL